LLLVILNSAVVAIGALSMILTLPTINILGVVQILLTLTAVAFAAILILKMKTPDLSKKQKRQILTPAILCVFLIINTIYWQFWAFWV